MSNWICSECGSADVFELGWVRTNRISWMLEHDVDVVECHDIYPKPQSKCMECGEHMHPHRKEYDNG